MRVLQPEVAEERKKRLLQWVIHHYIRTSRPIGSQVIAEEGKFSLSPATIRNTLKELEDEGFLFQPHASAGRVPTDKGYRFYVDYLVEAQRLASDERARIEREYTDRMAELDNLLAQTSRTLSLLSRSAGFALSPRLDSQVVKRIELVPIAAGNCLAILVTQSGLVRHWPFALNVELPPGRLRLVNQFLNENLGRRSVHEIQATLIERIEAAEREFRDLEGLFRHFLKEFSRHCGPEELYLEGMVNILPSEPVDLEAFRGLLNVVQEKKRLAELLEGEFEGQLKAPKGDSRKSKVQVKIGRENALIELKDLSVITSTYEVNDRVMGLLGIIGPKQMEYPKMIALVNFVSQVVSKTLSRWDEVYGSNE